MPDEEAWLLFKQVSGHAIDTNRDLNLIATQVFKECGGLPISILAVGNALKNKKKQEWQDALHQLRAAAPHHVNPFLKEAYPKLKLSYESLESKEAKKCFLLCSLFPEDYDVPVESLATYGIGLRLFQNYGSSLEDARRGARSAVSVLKTSYLLLDGRDDDYVRMHDVIRDVAIAIGSEDGEDDMFVAKAATGLCEWPEMPSYKNYTGISLMNNKISEVPDGLKCPKLQILLLQKNRSLSTIPDDLFQETEELKVIDLGNCAIGSLPGSLLLLTTLHTLRLDGLELQDISVLGELAGLEILGLSSTDVDKIPEQIGKLTNLRLLDMRDCDRLEYVAPGVISSLQKLEDLYIHHGIYRTFDQGNSRKLVSLAELNSLPKIKNLEIAVPHTELVLSQQMDLQFQSLQRFMIILGNTTETELAYMLDDITTPHGSMLYVTLNMEVPLLGWIKTLIKAADVLSLNKINDLSASDIDSNKARFLEITECAGVSSLAVTDMSDLAPKPIFCSVRRLKIKNLPNLTTICQGQLLTGESFRELEIISISRCQKMSTVLGYKLLRALQNLSSLYVRDCSSVEYILGTGTGAEICMEEGETKFLPALKDLRLSELPILVDIWNIVHNSRFISLGDLESVFIANCIKLRILFSSTLVNHLVSLEELHIHFCPLLEHIFEPPMKMEMGMHSMNGSSCFRNLCEVIVYSCGKLRYVFSPSIAEGLSRLKELLIASNKKLEAVIGEEKAESSSSSAGLGTQKKMVFPCLSKIGLSNLPKLKGFCSEIYSMIEYPSLRSLTVGNCPVLESWGHGVQLTPELKPEMVSTFKNGVELELRQGRLERISKQE